jgi:hypothetical protein
MIVGVRINRQDSGADDAQAVAKRQTDAWFGSKSAVQPRLDRLHRLTDGRIPSWIEKKNAREDFAQLLFIVLRRRSDLIVLGQAWIDMRKGR